MSSGFISEAEAAEARKRRQEEWERVRKPSDPVERPEEPYDNRSLYEKLQEQKQKKDLEYEEAHKLKNMIKGLDDDEIEFLDLIDRTKLAADRKKHIEEEKELNDYRNRVAILQEKSIEEKLQADKVIAKPKVPVTNKLNQQKLLKGVVVKKSPPKKRKMMDADTNDDCNERKSQEENSDGHNSKNNKKTRSDTIETPQVENPSALKCVGILPGLGYYDASSSEENSSDSENSDCEVKSSLDLLGRRILAKTGQHQEQK
ncbi:hypothetical protein ABEB36_003084 [Hypothenemus hampei]|uniref:FAM192A/Fyv6 N-terminal domain-containing protein n=1 Tax=Hypothenemus hampei TaxID=57062 RepID=A0ABD1F7Z3_HYPHA